jgi:hypothetical protein
MEARIRVTPQGIGSIALSNDKPMNEDLAARILGSMKKAYTGEQTVRWLANLNEDLPVQPAKGPKLSQSTSELSVRASAVLDRFFDEFQRYCYEFNKTVTDPEFRVQCERAKPVLLQMPYREEPIIAQGHLSTKVWSMILQAQESAIYAYIVPIDFLLGFHAERNNYEPHMVMKLVTNSLGSTSWQIDGVSVQTSMLPTISKKLFSALIRVFNEEDHYTHKFIMVAGAAPAAPAPGEIMQRPTGYEDKGFELLKPSVRPNMNLGNAVREQQANIEAQRQSGNVGYGAAPAPAAPAPSAPAPAAQQAPAAQRQAGSPEEALFLSTQGVHNGIDHFTHTLDRELDELTKLSMLAIQNSDMAFAQRAVARTAALKKFKDAAAAFKGDWQAVCTD